MTEISQERRAELRLKIVSGNEVPVRDTRVDADELRTLLDYADEQDRLVKQRDHERKRRAKAEPERDEAMVLLNWALAVWVDPGSELHDRADALLRHVGGNHD